MSGSRNVNSRISELRERGYEIENEITMRGNVKHSSYRVIGKAVQV
jgi:hypothetical protein